MVTTHAKKKGRGPCGECLYTTHDGCCSHRAIRVKEVLMVTPPCSACCRVAGACFACRSLFSWGLTRRPFFYLLPFERIGRYHLRLNSSAQLVEAQMDDAPGTVPLCSCYDTLLPLLFSSSVYFIFPLAPVRAPKTPPCQPHRRQQETTIQREQHGGQQILSAHSARLCTATRQAMK